MIKAAIAALVNCILPARSHTLQSIGLTSSRDATLIRVFGQTAIEL